MINRLSAENIETLKKLPEMGMGYQIVKAEEAEFSGQDIVVLNAQVAITREALENKNVVNSLVADNFADIVKHAKEIHLTFDEASFIEWARAFGQQNGGFGRRIAINSIAEKANGDELFVRLSAFEDDMRIDKKNKCLLPGSYTTTAADALRCKQEAEDPVQRYALPNELMIQWAFYIQANPADMLQRGNVIAGFDKKGGGREAFFDKGTSVSTFITQTKW